MAETAELIVKGVEIEVVSLMMAIMGLQRDAMAEVLGYLTKERS